MLLAVRVGRESRAFLKALDKIALAGTSATVGDLRDWSIGLSDQKILGAHHAQMVVKFLKGLIGDSVKVRVDLGYADVKALGDLSRGQGFVKVLDEILHHVKDVIIVGVEADRCGEGQEAVGFS